MRKLMFVIVMLTGCPAPPELEAITNEIVVDFQDDTTPEYIATLGKKLSINFRPESKYSSVDKMYVGQYTGENEGAVIEVLRKDSRVEAADMDMIYTIPEHYLPAGSEGIRAEEVAGSGGGFPNDEKFELQWGMKQIHLPKDWDSKAGDGVVVAVIDTGCTITNDLKATKFVPGYNFVDDNDSPLDGNQHGTHVCSTIAENTNNKIGCVGVAYKATMMCIKVLSDEGSGTIAAISEGVIFATNHGAKIINMSLGGVGRSTVLGNAIKYAQSKKVIVVAAAGNSATSRPSYPAAYDDVIAVAASGRDERTTHYSNFGKITITAPGGDGDRAKPENGILQNTIVRGEDGYYYLNGSSMASPFITSVVALIVERGITDPNIVRKILVDTARKPVGMEITNEDNYKKHYGAGLVDVSAAVAKAHSISHHEKATHGVLFGLLFVGLVIVLVYAWKKKAKK